MISSTDGGSAAREVRAKVRAKPAWEHVASDGAAQDGGTGICNDNSQRSSSPSHALLVANSGEEHTKAGAGQAGTIAAGAGQAGTIARDTAVSSSRIASAVCSAIQGAIADAVHMELVGADWAQVPALAGRQAEDGLAPATGSAVMAAAGRHRDRTRPTALRLADNSDASGDPAGWVWAWSGHGGEVSGAGIDSSGNVERIPDDSGAPDLESCAHGAVSSRLDDVRWPDSAGQRAGPGDQVSPAEPSAAAVAGWRKPVDRDAALKRRGSTDGDGCGVSISISAELVSVVVARPAPPAPAPPFLPPPPVEVAASTVGDKAAASSSLRSVVAEAGPAGDGRIGAGSQPAGLQELRANVASDRAGLADQNPADAGSMQVTVDLMGADAAAGT